MHHREAPGSALLALFNGKARCGTCHVPPLFTEPGWTDEIGIDDFQAKRGPDDRYVTAKLRALWDTKKIHKGGFLPRRTICDAHRRGQSLRQSLPGKFDRAGESDLIEYLKSI